jgi:hypothetical protein
MELLRALRVLRVQNPPDVQAGGQAGLEQVWLLKIDCGAAVLGFLYAVSGLHQQRGFSSS